MTNPGVPISIVYGAFGNTPKLFTYEYDVKIS
jgi:hypothetical protein